jgi:hypothetical protein
MARAGATLDNLSQTAKPNAKLIRQMANLSGPGIYKNPVAEKVLDEAQQQQQALDEQLPPEDEDTGEQETENAQSGRDNASFMMDGTLDQLFGDFIFFVCKTMMESSNDQVIELENAPILDQNETKLMTEVNNSKKHIIDLLDKLFYKRRNCIPRQYLDVNNTVPSVMVYTTLWSDGWDPNQLNKGNATGTMIFVELGEDGNPYMAHTSLLGTGLGKKKHNEFFELLVSKMGESRRNADSFYILFKISQEGCICLHYAGVGTAR